jgi:hypothetical protein
VEPHLYLKREATNAPFGPPDALAAGRLRSNGEAGNLPTTRARHKNVILMVVNDRLERCVHETSRGFSSGLVQRLFREELRHQVSHLRVIQVGEREVGIPMDTNFR